MHQSNVRFLPVKPTRISTVHGMLIIAGGGGGGVGKRPIFSSLFVN